MKDKEGMRRKKLEQIEKDVAAGKLVIRSMTKEERKKYGPPRNKPKPKKIR